MKYLLLALLNSIYGAMLLAVLNKSTPGYFLIVFIAVILAGLGLVGLILYFVSVFRASKISQEYTGLKNWFSIAKSVDIIIIIGLLFRAFVLQPFIVEGNSMEPNYHDKEYILVDQLTYRFRVPEHGEAIILRPPQSTDVDFIKRIIALPGETITIENSEVRVNGKLINEPYIASGAQTLTGEVPFRKTLGPKEYFVMGDNREHSYDSRELGVIPRANIIGKAWFGVYPLTYFGLIKNPSPNI